MHLSAVAAACAVAAPARDAVFTGVCTDSRQVQAGDLFVALRGERFDAHDFLPAVMHAGAAAALVERLDPALALPQLCVPDVVQALGVVARLNRARFAGMLIGLTGSAGKTTTKEMVAAILEQAGTPLVTRGNLNNHIGVPLTLLRLAPEHDSAVIEMGASAVGEIRYLTQMARPRVALVTTVAPAHLEGFGSIENVAIGKHEIYEGLPADGVAVVNLDNPWTAGWRDELARHFRVMTFSMAQPADVYADAISQDASGLRFVLHLGESACPIQLAFIGRHNVGNAVAAAACCMGAGIAEEHIVAGLQQARPYQGRLQPRRGRQGALVIDDSYNANPASVRMAIDALAAFSGEKTLVLGDMAELGADALSLHAGIGAYARDAGIGRLWATGPLSQATVEGYGAGASHFPDWQSLAEACAGVAGPQSVFLVKGSRSAGMERVADALAEEGDTSC